MSDEVVQALQLPTEGSLTQEHLQALYDISQTVNSITDIDSLLEQVMDIAIRLADAERGFLVWTESGALRVRTARNISPETALDLDGFSHTAINSVVRSGDSVLAMDAELDPRFSGADSVMLKGIRSVACVPFRLRGRILGALYLDSQTHRSRFHPETERLLNAFANQAAIAIENARLMGELREENLYLRTEVERRYAFSELIGRSPKMQQVFSLLGKIAESDIFTLFEGESGTGKELAARALHYNSRRREKPFVAQFCGNLSEHLLESELFGHKKGAFTGAISDKRGLLEVANGGTFFLDEVAEVPPAIQAKLLRVLQDGEFRRVGDTETRHVDVRVISATNKSLAKEVEIGRFREDLFYRLNVITVTMPPLRERAGDIPLLAHYFLRKHAEKAGARVKRMSSEAMRNLEGYHWPGNVRELENTIERAIVLAENHDITPAELIITSPPKAYASLKTYEEHGREYVLRTLKETGGNKTQTARILGKSLRWLHYRLREWKETDGEP
ncbi:MAG: sigma 54-interacting transcriptional regulator [bacterium]